MATLILTVVGGAIAGPIGASLGALIGGQIDRNLLFAPKGREGPRLSELKLQTSSYGTPIQHVFGTMRIGGSVIWSTELIESRASSGGKGQPSTTSYSYAASFAVALSGRPVEAIGRIWADGKLLRGAAGDFKTTTGFRLHRGDEAQASDPLIASAEGGALTPAHRGTAYVVFEQLQLADYGNRIPSLTFEVIADPGPVTVGAIAASVSDGLVEGAEAVLPLEGFAAYGDSVRSALDVLALAAGGWFAPDGASLRFRADGVPTTEIADGAVRDARSGKLQHGRTLAAIESVARSVTLSHYDPARDFQIGLQRARRPGAGARQDRIEMPAAIDADAAKTMVQAVLERAEAARERRSVALGWDALTVGPGACVTIEGAPGVWRVTGWGFEQGVLMLDCLRLAGATQSATASPGRALPAPDVATGATVLVAFEALPADDTLLSVPRVTVVATGTAPGWRRAALLYSNDDGARWTPAGATGAPGVIGRVAVAPGPAGSALIDLANTLEVELAHAALSLSGADAAGMDAGANLALVGGELIQFGVAEQIGATRWRLSRLFRGRHGTEGAMGTQAAGAAFALVDPDAATAIDLPLAALGTALHILASGPGDTAGPVEARVRVDGASVLPLAPCHLTAEELGDGRALVRWVRRSRLGWRWIDGVDSPLGEEREAYRVSLTRADGSAQSTETTEPIFAVALADRVAGASVAVRQAGALGGSAATTLDIAAWPA